MPQPALPEGAVSVGLLGSGSALASSLSLHPFLADFENEDRKERDCPPQSPQFDMN